MTDKVVTLTSSTHELGEGVQELVANLQETIGSESIQNLLVVGVSSDGSVTQWVANPTHKITMIGLIEDAKLNLKLTT